MYLPIHFLLHLFKSFVSQVGHFALYFCFKVKNHNQNNVTEYRSHRACRYKYSMKIFTKLEMYLRNASLSLRNFVIEFDRQLI